MSSMTSAGLVQKPELLELSRLSEPETLALPVPVAPVPTSNPKYRHVPPRMFLIVTPARWTTITGGLTDRSINIVMASELTMSVRTPKQDLSSNDVMEPLVPPVMLPVTLKSLQDEVPSIVLVLSMPVPALVA